MDVVPSFYLNYLKSCPLIVCRNPTRAPLPLVETPVTFVSGLKDTETFEEFTVTLECETSEPNRPVVWRKDGKELKQDARVKSNMADAVHSLTIKKTRKSDEAEYSAAIGDVVTKAQLTVVETDVTITKPLQDVTSPAGQDVTLQCEVSKPDRQATWLRNTTQIEPSRKLQITTDNTKQRLVIKNADKSDAAEYSCLIGQQETRAKVTITVTGELSDPCERSTGPIRHEVRLLFICLGRFLEKMD